jgi:hypothetical protein
MTRLRLFRIASRDSSPILWAYRKTSASCQACSACRDRTRPRCRPQPPHVVEAVRQAHLGTRHSAETRQRMSEAHKRRWQSITDENRWTPVSFRQACMNLSGRSARVAAPYSWRSRDGDRPVWRVAEGLSAGAEPVSSLAGAAHGSRRRLFLDCCISADSGTKSRR